MYGVNIPVHRWPTWTSLGVPWGATELMLHYCYEAFMLHA